MNKKSLLIISMIVRLFFVIFIVSFSVIITKPASIITENTNLNNIISDDWYIKDTEINMCLDNAIFPNLITIDIYDSNQLSILPLKASEFEWSSSDPKIVEIDSSRNGKIKALSPGEATIFIKRNGIVRECKITVKNPFDYYNYQLDYPNITFVLNKPVPLDNYTFQIKGHYHDSIRTINNSEFEWSSSDPQVVKTDDAVKGKVTAVAPGKAIIYAKINDKTLECHISVFSYNDMQLLSEVNGNILTEGSEINIDSPTLMSTYLYQNGVDRINTTWSADNDNIKIWGEKIIPIKPGKTTITTSSFGKSAKFYLNIVEQDLSKIKFKTNETFYTHVYYTKTGNASSGSYVQSNEILYKILVLAFPDGSEFDMTPYIDWKSSNPDIATFSVDHHDNTYFPTITSKSTGTSTFTGYYFGKTYSFNLLVDKKEITKPELSATEISITNKPPVSDPILPFKDETPSPMSSINKKLVYALKDNINDASLINDNNKDSITINSIKTGYFTQNKTREILAMIHLPKTENGMKVYNEVIGVFDSETYTIKACKVFKAKAPNSIFVNSSSILFIPADPDQNYTAKTVEVWTVINGQWGISNKPKETNNMRYSYDYSYQNNILGDYILVSGLNDEKTSWEVKYRLFWDCDQLFYCKNSALNDNETRTSLVQAEIPNVITNKINSNSNDNTNLSGLNTILDNLILKIQKKSNCPIFNSDVYNALRNPASDKSKIAANLKLLNLEYGYFTHTNRLELLVAFHYVGTKDNLKEDDTILIICDAETYVINYQDTNISLQNRDYTNNEKLFFYNDGSGKTSILIMTVSNYNNSNTYSMTSLLRLSGSQASVKEVGIAFNDYAILADKIFFVNNPKLYSPNGNVSYYNEENYLEYNWDPTQQNFIDKCGFTGTQGHWFLQACC